MSHILDTEYSAQAACMMGDYFANQNKLLSAEVCYSLVLVPDHPKNQSQQYSNISNVTAKLERLRSLRTNNNFKIPKKGVDIPSQALQLLKSFYLRWLIDHIKSDLIVCNSIYIPHFLTLTIHSQKRSEEHTTKRAEELVKIFNEVW